MAYKWQLRRGSKKAVCPACGQRRFVPYVLSADNATLAGAEFGRCDREQNCGYHKHPTKNTPAPVVAPAPAVVEIPLTFAPAVVKIRRSALFNYIAQEIGIDSACALWDKYRIGATQEGRTLFWQISAGGEVRAGKAIKYNADGHRDKNAVPPVAWAHKMREFEGMCEGNALNQCFFGEHLLAGNNNPVAIVESEKTAVYMSYWFPHLIWLACGGSQNLKKAERHAVLTGRRVVLIPDNLQYWNWFDIATKYHYRITDFIEQHAPFAGADIMDYFVGQWKHISKT